MVGIARSISYGKELMQYINGETRDKKHPELIYHVKNNILDDGLDAFGMWFKMREHAQMQKSVIHVIISPAMEHTRHFTVDDWRRLWNDFVKEYDNIEQETDGVVYSHKTNLAGSMATVWLHLESDSGIPHLHAAVCRKDMNGVTNNDHHIGKRAQRAAEAVALKRGWKTAAEIHDSKIEEVSDICIGILKSMPEWDWIDYVGRLEEKGCKVNEYRDGNKVLHGYSISVGNSCYKASDLGKGRNLMVSKIDRTWQKLHPDVGNTLQQDENKAETNVATDIRTFDNRTATKSETNRISYYTEWRENTSPYDIAYDGKQYRFHIPDGVMKVFNDEFDFRDTANHDDLTNLAVAIFVGLTALDTVSTGSDGGGGGNDGGWRDKKDEDEIGRARRCVRAAVGKIGKTMKKGHRR